jgi:putative restriction endonuclease
MLAYIGVTDYAWFDLLRNIPQLEEVNFWQPGGNQVFKALKPGDLFLFKLHYPWNKIVGGGIFAYSNLSPISLAWDSFGIKNGANSYSEMRQRVGKLRHQTVDLFTDYKIGCILLQQPFFLPENEWIPAPPDWNLNIVQGKRYDLSSGYGLLLLKRLHVSTLLASVENSARVISGVAEEQARYGKSITTFPRLGQGSFRILVTDLYERRCAVTNEKTLPALDAAHIKPYSESGKHIVSNGILLRRDLHALFDKGYVTITPSMKFEVSRRIKEEYENGRDYYRLQGTELRLPLNPTNHPSQEYIKWHNENKYRG